MQFIAHQLYYCALHSELATFAIDYGDLAVVEIVEDMDRLSRTHVTEEVGAGGSNGNFAFLDETSCVRMLWGSDSHESSLGSDHHGQEFKVGLQYDS
jgi:hypothetical protein